MAMRRTVFICALASTLGLAACATPLTVSAAGGSSSPAASTPPATPQTAASPSPSAAGSGSSAATSPVTIPPAITSAPAATAAPVTTPPASPKSASPASVVEAYYDAINDQDYPRAWSLGGDNLGGTYSQFADGFADTAADSIQILGTSGHTVSVDLTATNDDGSKQTFAGSYTVSDGRITSASISPTGDSGGSGGSGGSLCGAPFNPYGYNFCGGSGLISSPPADICSYFHCISNFSKGHGYMVECRDQEFSMSGGIGEVCSDNGGVEQNVYDK